MSLPTLAAPERTALRTHQQRSPVRLAIRTDDTLVMAGLLGELRTKPGIHLVDDPRSAEVVVAVAESGLRDLLDGASRLVLVADQPKLAELWTAVEHGLVVLLPRKEATTTRLLQAVFDAQLDRGHVPAEHLGQLLRELTRLQEETLGPRDLTLGGFSARETAIVRLLAEGLDTAEVAAELAYSERTVKKVLHALLSRLGLSNRVHAVAHALRHGYI